MCEVAVQAFSSGHIQNVFDFKLISIYKEEIPMMTKMRAIALKKNQKGLAIVEYVIVLAVVAALAAYVFGSDTGIDKELKSKTDTAVENIKKVPSTTKP